MKILCRYWSPKCIYTGNQKVMDKQIELYGKGFLTESDLRKDVAKVKALYDLKCKEEFSSKYND